MSDKDERPIKAKASQSTVYQIGDLAVKPDSSNYRVAIEKKDNPTGRGK